MNWILLAATLLVVLVVAGVALNRGGGKTQPAFRRQDRLLTPAERSFFGVLEQVAGDEFKVFAKVRVGDVLAPVTGLNQSQRQVALNQINRKHFDFAICSAGDLSVLCVIELNDKSHQREDRARRDAFLADACASAGLPLLTFDAKRSYQPSEVSERIVGAVKGAA